MQLPAIHTKITSWTSVGCIPALSTAALTTCVPRAGAGIDDSVERNDPIGVLTAEAIITPCYYQK